MSPAYDPDTGYFYLEAIEGCQTQIKASQKFKPGGFPFNGTGAVDIPDEPLQVYIRALELTTGKLAWEYKVIGSRDFGAGVLATAGGLLFAGSTEGSFMAFNARNGKVVWHFNAGQPISASPMTYAFQR